MSTGVTDVPHLQEKVLARHLLSASASKASSTLDSFGNWLLGGFAAVVAFSFGSFAEISAYVPISTVRIVLLLFLFVVVTGAAQKYLAAGIAAAAESAAIAAEAGERVAEVPIDFSVVFGELKQATLAPMRWLVRRDIAAAERGDFAASGRFLARLAQLQGILVLAEATLIVTAVSLVVSQLGRPQGVQSNQDREFERKRACVEFGQAHLAADQLRVSRLENLGILTNVQAEWCYTPALNTCIYSSEETLSNRQASSTLVTRQTLDLLSNRMLLYLGPQDTNREPEYTAKRRNFFKYCK